MPPASDAFTGSFVIGNPRDQIESALREMLDAVERQGYDTAATFAIRLAMEEALSNAIKHGNRGDPHKRVRIECAVQPDSITLEIEDEGEGFDPETVPDPTAPENVEIPAGRGLTIMRAFMSEVAFIPPGNRVRMTYRKPAA